MLSYCVLIILPTQPQGDDPHSVAANDQMSQTVAFINLHNQLYWGSVCTTNFSKSVTCFGTPQVPSSGSLQGCEHNALEMVLCRTVKKNHRPSPVHALKFVRFKHVHIQDTDFRKLFNIFLNNLHSSPNIVRVITRRVRWAGHVVRMGRDRRLQGFGVET